MSQIIIEEWRDLWPCKTEFLFVSCAYVFSISNLLRLPYMIWMNGGLVFYLAYLLVIGIAVLPIIIMELTVGQLTGRAPPQAMLSVCPLFKGVGIAHVLYTLVWMSLTGVLLAYLCLYVFTGAWHITEPHWPWTQCKASTMLSTTTLCQPSYVALNESVITPTALGTLMPYGSGLVHTSIQQTFNSFVRPAADVTALDVVHEEGWSFWVLGAVAVVWAIVLIGTVVGVRWMGKVCVLGFFIACGLLVALLVRVLIMEDVFMMVIRELWARSHWEAALHWHFWERAISQALYATGLGFGAYITLGSYNKRSNNLVFDTVFILKVHLGLTVGLVFLVFGLASMMTQQWGITSKMEHFLSPNFIDQWHFLFAAVDYIPLARLWSALLLIMVVLILFIQLDVFTLNVLATLEDALGESASRCVPRACLAFLICFFTTALSLVHTTTIGVHSLRLAMQYIDLIVPWIILICEVLAVGYFYCAVMLAKDIKHLVRAACCWCMGGFLTMLLYLAPLAPAYVLGYKLWHYSYVDDVPSSFFNWSYSECVGWTVAIVILLPIPLTLIYMIVKTCVRGPGNTAMQKLKYTVISPLRYEVVKPTPAPRYTATAPGYVLLPQQAPLAEPEHANYDIYGERNVRMSNI